MNTIIDLTVSDTHSDVDSVIDLCSDFEYDSSDSDVEYINVDQVQCVYDSDTGIEEFVNLFGVEDHTQDHTQDLPPLDEALLQQVVDFDFDTYVKPNTVAQYTGTSQKRGIQLTDRHARALKRQKV